MNARHVLLVEDERLVARLYARAIEAAGHEAELADNGEDALDRIASRRPALIISDLNMPGMTGIEMARRLIASDGKRTPMILMSGEDGQALLRQALAAGFDDFLIKGASFGQLGERLRLWLDPAAPPGLPSHIRHAAQGALDRTEPSTNPIQRLNAPIDRLVGRAACLAIALLRAAPANFGANDVQQLRLAGVIDGIVAALVRSNPLGQLRRVEAVLAVARRLGDDWLARLSPLLADLDRLGGDTTFRHAANGLSLTGQD
jgi:CheY-like chemotaxis protein